MTTDKVRENRLRRKAGRQGLRLEKSRRRDPQALDYERYAIFSIETNSVVIGRGPVGPSLDLDDVEDFLLHGFDGPRPPAT